ncbi:MAG: TlyA family RNA methyltransferase [Victivallales bacterium]|nr:TlyA family RNA methyltransferase [Victivallales bacterium]
MKVRADQLAVEQGLCESRTLAQRLIMAGQIRLGPDAPVRKPGQLLDASVELMLIAPPQYVSRGAFKLLGALDEYKPDTAGIIALDLGASTGGFTDLLLQRGASKVYAVDVGYGQLHDKLRRDARVVSLERTNARDLTREIIPEDIDMLVGDVSFISLTKVLPPCGPFLKQGAWIMVLVKPQFECERHEVGSGGVVRDEAVRQRCVDKIVAFCRDELGWNPVGVVPSPILGPKGNQEFIAVFRKG